MALMFLIEIWVGFERNEESDVISFLEWQSDMTGAVIQQNDQMAMHTLTQQWAEELGLLIELVAGC